MSYAGLPADSWSRPTPAEVSVRELLISRRMLAFGAFGEGPSGTVSADDEPQARLLDAFGRRP